MGRNGAGRREKKAGEEKRQEEKRRAVTKKAQRTGQMFDICKKGLFTGLP